MTMNSESKRIGWRGQAMRGAAILALLAGAACQRGPSEDEGKSGLFGGAGKQADNKSRDPVRSVRGGTREGAAEPVAPVVVAPAPAATPGAPAPAGTQDRRVRINNQSGMTITLIKGSAVSQGDWGQDRIPTTTLTTGGSTIVDFNDNNGECSYDLQATLSDGTTRNQRAVNICQITDWTITPSGTQVK